MIKTAEGKKQTFVLVQMLQGLTFPRWCIDFVPLQENSEAQETALFIGLEVGSFKSFLVVYLEFPPTQIDKLGSACRLDRGH